MLVIDAATGTFNFFGGTLSVNQIDGDLVQDGGAVDPNRGIGSTVVNGDYVVSSAGALRIEVNGAASTDDDLLSMNGTLDLNSDAGAGASLQITLGFAASIGDSFLFLQNDGADAVSGTFQNLGQGGRRGTIPRGGIVVLSDRTGAASRQPARRGRHSEGRPAAAS